MVELRKTAEPERGGAGPEDHEEESRGDQGEGDLLGLLGGAPIGVGAGVGVELVESD